MTRGGGGCCLYYSLNSIATLAWGESHPQAPLPGPAKIRSRLVPTFPAPSLCLLAYHSLETDAKRQWLIFYSCIFGLSYRFQQTLATFEIHFFSLCYFFWQLIMKIFKHRSKLKVLCSDHPYTTTYSLHLTFFLLALSHIYPSIHPSVHYQSILFSDTFWSKRQMLVHSISKHFGVYIIN